MLNGVYKKIVIVRPILEGRHNLGFYRGSKEKKLGYHMQPIFDALEKFWRPKKPGEKFNPNLFKDEVIATFL